MMPSVRLTADSDSTSTALDVSLRGKIFPDRPRPSGADDEKPHPLRCELEQSTLATRLAEALWLRLPFCRFDASLPDEASILVKAYVDSVLAIQHFHNDVAGLFGVVCESNLRFRQESGTTNEPARAKALQAKLDEMLSRTGMPLVPPVNVLSGGLVSEPLENLHHALQAALRKELAKFGQQFVAALEHAVEQRLMGLIEWVGPTACQYHFFREIVLQENDGVKRSVSTTEVRNAPLEITPEGRTRRLRRVQHVRELHSGQHTLRLSRHEHHVMNAFSTSIRNSRVIMTPEAQRLAGSIPEWLYDFVRVIDGDIVRERIIERDYSHEKWEDLIARDIPVYGCEPAIIIGQFVLTGWGPTEVEAERSRREAKSQAHSERQTVQFARRERIAWLVAGIASIIGSIILWAVSHASNRSQIWSVLMFLGGLHAATQFLRTHSQTHGRASRWFHIWRRWQA